MYVHTHYCFVAFLVLYLSESIYIYIYICFYIIDPAFSNASSHARCDVQQPVPWELLQLILQFAQEEKGAGPLPDWAATLGFESFQLPPQQLTITSEQRNQISGSIAQELSLCRLQVNQRSREDYEQWLSNSSAGSLKPLFKCLRKYEASVERPFPTFSAASKLLLRLQQWSSLWCSSGTPPACLCSSQGAPSS